MLHPNEIQLVRVDNDGHFIATTDGAAIIDESAKLGKRYVAARQEQTKRQMTLAASGGLRYASDRP